MAYMIGLPHRYDHRKVTQDMDGRIAGIECTQYSSEAELEKVLEAVRNKAAFMGIHFPLRTSTYERRDPLVCHEDEEVRECAFQAIEQELIEAVRLQAKYLLIHFPKPMYLDAEVDWRECRFLPDEMITEAECSDVTFRERCRMVVNRLDALAGQYGVPIYLELDLVQKRFYEEKWLTTILEENRHVRLCLDTCRTVINALLVPDFDPVAFMEAFAPYTALLHVSNVNRGITFNNNHHSVLPELNGVDGWGDVQQLLEVMQPFHQQIDVLFEHDSSRVDQESLIRCYDYVQGILEGCLGERVEQIAADKRVQ